MTMKNTLTSADFAMMLQLARQAKEHAYARYSHFHVGACVRTSDNHFFHGCNVENSVYPLTQCAEASAIGNMVTHGYTHIADILIIADTPLFCPPCGACRQKIVEFADQSTRIHMCNAEGEAKTLAISELLPFHFGNEHLTSTK